ERRILRKEYYSVGEVCELVGLKPHVLRYWESQFPHVNPSRNRAGNRVYQAKQIRVIMLVKQLLHRERYTIEGAKAKLEELRRGGELAPRAAAALDAEALALLRSEMEELRRLLEPGERVSE